MGRVARPSDRPGLPGRIWRRLCRFSITRRRLSRRSLDRLCAETASDDYTLVVHSNDVDHRRYFPNSFIVARSQGASAALTTDAQFQDLALIGTASFRVILCTGLLEHIREPERLIGEFHRILKPGGRLIMSASAVFPFHGAPDNYFHFTDNGFRWLFRGWTRLEVLRGSSQPFETIAILLQRINLQCDIFPPVRLLVELLFHVLPWLDLFVLRQYDSLAHRDRRGRTETFMPATLHAVVIR